MKILRLFLALVIILAMLFLVAVFHPAHAAMSFIP